MKKLLKIHSIKVKNEVLSGYRLVINSDMSYLMSSRPLAFPCHVDAGCGFDALYMQRVKRQKNKCRVGENLSDK